MLFKGFDNKIKRYYEFFLWRFYNNSSYASEIKEDDFVKLVDRSWLVISFFSKIVSFILLFNIFLFFKKIYGFENLIIMMYLGLVFLLRGD